ncbi:NAD-dependent epimerase/dehydratase family protein [Dickeya chrysanthemi]|uniref:NAD-dependent epimerase/dehydratase family protein n=1 Tax=Dickeya chrysanthemi TaxID=556 RepID=UPI00039FDC9C|nr:NAD(P)-dependent oxidoreductase [Dickeya chrysanthemi]
MKKILITGITGFIGSHLAIALERENFDVGGSTNSIDKVNEKISLVDFSSEDNIATWINNHKPDVIVHTAAITNVMHKDFSEIYRVNVIYTENLLNAIVKTCPRNTNVIVVSTAGVYGNNQSDFIEEKSYPKPNNHYSYSKLIVENLCEHYRDILNINVIRPFNIIGKGQRENFLIPKLVSYFANRVDNIPLGNIDAVRDYLSIDDCVRILIRIISKNISLNGPVNICSGQGYSARDAINLLESISGYKLSYYIAPEFVRKNEVWRLVGCSKKLSAIMGESGVVTSSFENTLSDIYHAYLNKVK